MLTTVKVVQRMPIKEPLQISFLADYMLASRHENTTRAKHAVHLGTRKL